MILAVVGGLGVATWRQSATWHDSVSLWTHALPISLSSVAYCNLGTTFARRGAVEKALELFRTSLQMRPDYIEARYNLGGGVRGELIAGGGELLIHAFEACSVLA